MPNSISADKAKKKGFVFPLNIYVLEWPLSVFSTFYFERKV